ncbi:MAG: radical SAM family heme chaperone HemW [Eubacteriaceae bacterium]|jgi:oxygen-independent coproporphyrinogen-3 oxidase|nr:radical SAM family heme chaperone HemW [Eubacteriaceae bacterium]
MEQTLGLYIHIPFCERKCKYCGFLSLDRVNDPGRKKYIGALRKELTMYGELCAGISVDTVFIGGGTPSLLDAADIGALMSCVRDSFSVAPDAEVTIEANPNSLTEEKLKIYAAAGINRLSIGVQSFSDDVLRTLGRIHDSRSAVSAYETARGCGFDNINIDLMSGIPSQTFAQWKSTVSEVLRLRPEHISFYSLQLEEGTPFYESYKNGEMDLVDDVLDRGMYHYAADAFKAEGYEHYEISNAALPGRECRHNLKYWSLREYIGAGLGASSYFDGRRYADLTSLGEYIAAAESGRIPADSSTVHEDTESDSMGIYCFTSLRTSRGIDLLEFEKLFGRSLYKAYSSAIGKIGGYIADGYIHADGRFLSLTEKGIDCSNDIMSEFV